MASNSQIEFEVLVNGTPAIIQINKVKKAQDDLANNTDSMAKKMEASWIVIGAKIGTAALAIKALGERGAVTEKATWNLTSSMKTLVADLSKMTGLSQDVTAGFVTTAQSAGLSSKEIEKMTQQAVALGRLYPHESTETFIDNLSMLYTSGEAQGYIVDILEQKYGTLDLKTLSLSDKMKVLDEKTKGVNERFSDLASSEITTVSSSWGILFDTLGEKIINLGSALGIFNALTGAADGITKGINLLSLRFESTGESVKGLYGWLTNNDKLVKQSQDNVANLAVEYNNLKNGIKTYTEQDVENAQNAADAKAKLQVEKAKLAAVEQGKIAKVSNQATADFNKAMRDAETIDIKDESKKRVAQYNSEVVYINELYEKGIITRLEQERKLSLLLKQFSKNDNAIFKDEQDKKLKEWQTTNERQVAIRQQYSEKVQQLNDTEFEHNMKILAEEVSRLEAVGATEIEIREYTAARTKEILESTAGTSEHLYKQMGDTFKNSFADRTTDSIMEMAKTGKASFSDLANSIMDDLARMIIRQQLFNAVSGISFGGGASTPASDMQGLDGGGNSWNAQGNVFSSNGQERYAQGGIFNAPTDFRFAGGTGILGEKGSEAIMPLKRTSNGDLGVVASGGASNVKVEVVNQSSQQVQANDVKITKSEQEGMIVSIVVGDIQRGGAIAQAIRS